MTIKPDTEKRIAELEAELALQRAKSKHWQSVARSEEESATWAHGHLANIADIAFCDHRRAMIHGYEGLETRVKELVAKETRTLEILMLPCVGQTRTSKC